MPKRSCGHKIGAVRKRRTEQRGEVAIVDGEFLRQVVVERNVVLIVEPHRLVFRRGLGSIIELPSHVINSDEAITQKACKLAVEVEGVHMFMNCKPGLDE